MEPADKLVGDHSTVGGDDLEARGQFFSRTAGGGRGGVEAAAEDLGNDGAGSAFRARGDLLGGKEHVLIEIEGGFHAGDAGASEELHKGGGGCGSEVITEGVGEGSASC